MAHAPEPGSGITAVRSGNAKKLGKQLQADVFSTEIDILAFLKGEGDFPFEPLTLSQLGIPEHSLVPGVNANLSQAFEQAPQLPGFNFQPTFANAPNLTPFNFQPKDVVGQLQNSPLTQLNTSTLGDLLSGNSAAFQNAFQFDPQLRQQFLQQAVRDPLLEQLSTNILPNIAEQFLTGGQTGAAQRFSQQALRQTGKDIAALELGVLRDEEQFSAQLQDQALNRLLSGQLGAAGLVNQQNQQFGQLGLTQEQIRLAGQESGANINLQQQQLIQQTNLAQQGLLQQNEQLSSQAALQQLSALLQTGGIERSIEGQQLQEELFRGMALSPFFDPRLGLTGALSGNPLLVQQGSAGVAGLGNLLQGAGGLFGATSQVQQP